MFPVPTASSSPYGITGDYNGDGKTDIAVFRPSTGTWWSRYSGTPTFAAVAWGVATDIPVPGHYDGHGQAEVAVYRGSTGVWFVRRPDGSLTSGHVP